ncbi:MAG: PIN domain-containing protein [Bosea sp. (in: a-proteobacteria)]|uniref:PIN domain-containing protein n=1 Tax=Bosea sp. (in: a-proteobacteria) TaxID=1871050 RepID=UPI003F7CC43A
MPKVFLDSNVIIYAFTDDRRSVAAEALLASGGDLSVQVLNEFTNVVRRKLAFDWGQVEEALNALRARARAIHPLDLETHSGAITIAQRYGFSFYDALIVSSALRARCNTLYSEDMQDGLVVEGSLQIVNPFMDPTPKSGEA